MIIIIFSSILAIVEPLIVKLYISDSLFELRYEISNNVVCATSKASDKPAHMRSQIRDFARRLNSLWLLSY